MGGETEEMRKRCKDSGKKMGRDRERKQRDLKETIRRARLRNLSLEALLSMPRRSLTERRDAARIRTLKKVCVLENSSPPLPQLSS